MFVYVASDAGLLLGFVYVTLYNAVFAVFCFNLKTVTFSRLNVN